MGLTYNQKELIKELANNDIIKAKKAALACVLEDKTQKNAYFCSKYEAILRSPGVNFIELPSDIKQYLIVEDVSASFCPERYYASDLEKELYEKISQMQRVSTKLMECKLPYLNSVLMFGEPGTGKTLFGRYLAYKLNLPFAYINISMLLSSYMGNTGKNLSKIFAFIRSYPCVFMIDEIDAICKNRSTEDKDGTSSEMARVTITIMQELDRLDNKVIVLAATNRIDRIDKAILRRFSITAEFIPFSEDEKSIMLQMLIDDIKKYIDFDISSEEKERILKSGNQSKIQQSLIQYLAKKI